MKRILVIGASGRVGRQVVSQSLSADTRIRALFRNPDSANLPSEVEVVRGDLTVPETLDASLDGVDSVFLVWTAPAAAVPAALERIARHAGQVVFLSSPHQTSHPLFQGSLPNPVAVLHANIERLIRASGLRWTFLRPGMLAANAVSWWAPQIRAGDVVRWPYAHVPTAPIDECDIAAVAVRALSDESTGAEYVLTGPESLSHVEQVSTIGSVLGRSLGYEEVAPADWLRQLPADIPAPAARMLLAAWGAAVGQPALITSTVAEIIGKPSRTFGQWAMENAAAFLPHPSART